MRACCGALGARAGAATAALDWCDAAVSFDTSGVGGFFSKGFFLSETKKNVHFRLKKRSK